MKSKVQSPKSKVQRLMRARQGGQELRTLNLELRTLNGQQQPRTLNLEHRTLNSEAPGSFIGRRGARGVESMLSGKQSEIQPTGTIFKRVLQRVCKWIAGMVTGDPPSSDYGAASLAAAGQEWGCYAG
jgi:hypothetical protein